jgi:bifunctional non-homologous end joining protein LigD
VLPSGLTSFQALQNSFRGGATNLIYFAFDLLFIDGEDLRALPLEQRKARLQSLLAAPGDPRARLFRFSDHVIGDGDAFLRGACGMGMEGIVSKKRDQPYLAGRNAGWLKIKCTKRQELVIGGFTDPEGSRRGIGALLVGYYDADRRFIFAGRVGTGFTEKLALDLRRRLDALERPQTPFQGGPLATIPRGARWVSPRLVCEVAFGEWTDEGSLRHPSFQGLRLDKKPIDVVREVAR